MNTRQLETFISIVDTGTLTAAAAQLYKTQGAVSHDLKALETSVGVRLLDRSTKRARLTTAGQALLPMARRIVADLEDTRSEMRRIRDGDRPIIRLACLPSLGPRICHLLADYCPQSTDTRWSLVTALRGPIVAGLRDGRFDLAVCESQADDDLLNSLLMHEPMRMILPANHPLTNRQPLRPSDVADIPYIGLHRSLGAANEAQRFFAAAELPPTPVVEVNDISLVPQLVTTISGYGFLPLSAAANSEEVAFVDTEPVLTRQISLTRIAKRSLSPAIVAFADYLTTQWNEQAMRQ